MYHVNAATILQPICEGLPSCHSIDIPVFVQFGEIWPNNRLGSIFGVGASRLGNLIDSFIIQALADLDKLNILRGTCILIKEV